MIELILGGARSGKSRHAEHRASEAQAAGQRVVYVATGEARDAEMAARIRHHQARRPAAWGLLETPVHLAAALAGHADANTCLLVDCLTLWLTNLILGDTARQAGAACVARDSEAADARDSDDSDDSGDAAGADGTDDCSARPDLLDDRLLSTERAALLATLPRLPGRIILVSNEVGWGIVPLGALSRRFVDEQGRLNQDIGALADRVTLVVGGLPLVLKSSHEN